MKKRIIIISAGLFMLIVAFMWSFFAARPSQKIPTQSEQPLPTTVVPRTQEQSQINQNLKKVINYSDDFQRLVTNDFKQRSLENARGSEQRVPSDYQTTIDNVSLSNTVISGSIATVRVEIITTTTNTKTGFQTGSKEAYEYKLKLEDNVWKVDDVNLISAEPL